MTLTVWFVVTPNVLLLDYAGPAEALRMAGEMGADIALHTCAPLPNLRTSLGVELAGLVALPPRVPPASLVIVAGNACEAEDYARPEAHAVVAWPPTPGRPGIATVFRMRPKTCWLRLSQMCWTSTIAGRPT